MPDDQQASPPAPPPSFGADLRKEREIRGISPEEVADSTKISHPRATSPASRCARCDTQRYLEAIEKDDYNILPR